MAKEAKHRGIFGATGSGKTYFALDQMQLLEGRVLFFNPQAEKVKKAVNVNWRDGIRAVLECRRANYIPQSDPEVAALELDRIVREMMVSPRTHYLICDEAHDFAPQGGKAGPLELIARRGRAKDVHLWALSVHPADISKTILRQLREVVLFAMPYSSRYLESYRIPADNLSRIHAKGGRYSYAVWDGLKMAGPHKIR